MRRAPGPSRSRVAALAALAAVGVGVAAARARAGTEPPSEAIHIAYQAPAGCADRDQFVAAVMSRTSAVRLVAADQAARRFAVSVVATDDGYAGRVEVVGAVDEPVRELEAPDCDGLVAAMALVTALAIDPTGPTGPPPPPPGTPPADAAVVVRPRARTIHVHAIGGLALVGDVTPGVMALAAVGAAVERPGLGQLRLELTAGRDGVDVDGARARFGWAAARLGLCPRDVRLGGRWTGRACAAAEVGLLRARGDQIDAARGETRPWLAASAGVGAAVRLSARIRVGLVLQLAVPLVRDRFFFVPDRTVHRVGAAIPMGGLELTTTIW